MRQGLISATGLIYLIRAILFRPFDVPGVLFGGTEHVWFRDNPSGDDWTYLPRLHVAEIGFVILFTAILAVLAGRHASIRQKQVVMVTMGAFCLLGAVWFPHSLGGFWFGHVAEIVGDADIILAISLSFMLFLRHDPV
jgi:hypothetical protein